METFTKTTDINIAGYLMTLGYKIEGLQRKEGSRQVHFVFTTEMNKELITGYWKGLKVPACDFVANLKELKSRLKGSIS